MAELTLTKTRIARGTWEGVLERTGNGAKTRPAVEVLHEDRRIPGAELTPDPAAEARWTLRVPIPPEALSDGVQSFVIRDEETGERLSSFAVALGDIADEDIRAELGLLRAELDLLKRAFRRHCAKSDGGA